MEHKMLLLTKTGYHEIINKDFSNMPAFVISLKGWVQVSDVQCFQFDSYGKVTNRDPKFHNT